MKTILTLMPLIVAALQAVSQGSITNISAAQRLDGSLIVDVIYDLSGSEPGYFIDTEVSFDDGQTYTRPNPQNLTGQVGSNVAPGNGRTFTWDFGAEFPGQYSNQTIIRLSASVFEWVCGDSLYDPRDGQVYKTVQMGAQCWMAENLNVGDMILGGTSPLNNGIIEKYCYGNLQATCDTLGGLYLWDEMMQYVTLPGTQGICPDGGWHIPTDEECKELEGFADSQYGYPDPEWDELYQRGFDAGKNLKSAFMWINNGNGTDLYGFTMLPAGYYYAPVSFQIRGNSGFLWTSSEQGTGASSMMRQFTYSSDQSFRNWEGKNRAYSVRCVRN